MTKLTYTFNFLPKKQVVLSMCAENGYWKSILCSASAFERAVRHAEANNDDQVSRRGSMEPMRSPPDTPGFARRKLERFWRL
jgi:hypothetical protein